MKKVLSLFLGMALVLSACQSPEISTSKSPDRKVYTALEDENAVAVVDPAEGTLLQKIPVPGMAHNVQISADGNSVWVTSNAMDEMGEDQLIVISTETDTVTQEITLGSDLHLAHVVLSSDGQWAYATAQEQNEIFVVNAQTFALEKTIALPEASEPHGLRLSPDGSTAYLALMEGKGVGIMNLQTEEFKVIDFGDAVVQTGVTPDGKTVFASLYYTRQLGLYFPETQTTETIALPDAKGPVQVYATPDSRTVYVADQGYYFDQPTSDKVFKVDLKSREVIATITAGEGPHGVAISGDGSEVYVTNLLSGDLSIIDTQTDTVTQTISVGKTPNGVTVWEKRKSSDIVELHDGDTFDLMAGIIEKEINGSTVEMLAYNGSIPGPTLKIPQGATITLNLTNNIDVPTTLHSHGVRMENAFDGVPDVTQKPIERGETFSYKLKFPDAGVFWYHPHLREDWAQELGLYGNFLVTPTDASAWEPVNREVPIFVDDLLMQNGEIAAFYGEADHALMGRYGNVFLTNGETDYTLPVQKGEVVRFDFTNSANTRPFKLSIPGLKMKLVGADNDRYERETWQDAIILGPSERAMVDVLFEQSGTYNLTHSTPTKEYTLGTFTVSGQAVDISHAESFQTLHENADVIAEMNPLRTHLEKDPDQKLRIDVKMEGMAGMHDMGGGHMMMNADMGGMMSDANSEDGIEWEDSMATMNSMATADTVMWRLIDEVTKKENMDINWSFKKGDFVKIRIFNDPDTFHPMQHPIHFHGQRFVVLSVDGTPNENMVWKDTTLIPSGATVDILLEASNPGKWMAHCHVPEHLESGMMLNFEVL